MNNNWSLINHMVIESLLVNIHYLTVKTNSIYLNLIIPCLINKILDSIKYPHCFIKTAINLRQEKKPVNQISNPGIKPKA